MKRLNGRILFFAVFLLSNLASALGVEITPNSVYRIKSDRNTYMTINGSLAVTRAYDASDDKQEWFFVADKDNKGYYLRNVSSGAYLKSSLATSAQWSLVFTLAPNPDDMLMLFTDCPGVENRVLLCPVAHTGSYQYAHNDAGSNVVCWTYGGNMNTTWILESVPKTDEEIEALQEYFSKVSNEMVYAPEYEKHLDGLFVDKACTTLKDNISLEDNADYNALSPVLREMVAKVYNKDWAETDTYLGTTAEWNDRYARKYRVQDYEAYSDGSTGAGLAGILAYTNMNNPTGIVGDKGDMIYIMVDDDIKPGATLYVGEAPDCNMYNSATSGIKLHKGLNIINCSNNNSHYFIYYTVNTVGPNRTAQNNLAGYPPIRIHIEGGRINGFFNYVGDDLYGQDTMEDFEYTVQRATHPMYDFVGRYVILHMHLFDTPSQDGGEPNRCVKTCMFTDRKTDDPTREYDPVKIVSRWDKMCFAELMMMGLLGEEDIKDEFNQGAYESIVADGYTKTIGTTEYVAYPNYVYRDYFNNRMMGISQQGSLFMNATAWRTAYNVSTIEAILTRFCHGDIWGPAHEYGHMNQNPMNLAGTTEESNNIFSNVAVYYLTNSTSRSDFLSSQLKVFLDKGTFLKNETWGTTRMFWQLWLYYHLTGHNTKFYPRLYELLRKYPIKKTTVAGGTHNAKDDLLHFAKMCCIAAGEDLTDFFTAWGFFVPLDNYLIDDYSQYNACLTQEDIDKVKAEIKSLGFEENQAIIFIDDRPGSERDSYSGFPKEKAGELGGLKDFRENRTPSGEASFMIEGNSISVTVDGDPGVGFIIRDENGDLLAFSNSYNFQLNAEVIAKLADGSATITAVGADGSTMEVSNPILNGTIDEKKAILSTILKEYQNDVINYIDISGNNVGYIVANKESQKLIELRDEAQQVLDDASIDTETVSLYISLLLNTRVEIPNDPLLKRVEIEDGASYRIINANSSLCLTTDDGTTATVKSSKDDFVYEWVLTYNEEANGYSLLNFDYTSGTYITSPKPESKTVYMTDSVSIFTMVPVPGKIGKFGILADGRTDAALSQTSSTAAFGNFGNDANTQWRLTKIHDAEYADLHCRLGDLIQEAQNWLMDNIDYWELDSWLELSMALYYATNTYGEKSSSKEELDQQADDLNNSLKYAQAEVAGSKVVTFQSVKMANDMTDNIVDTDIIRQTFNNNGTNRFENLIMLESSLEATNIKVDITPVGGRTWASTTSKTENLRDEYAELINETAQDALVVEHFNLVDADHIDGFYTTVTGYLEENPETPGCYDLVIDAPCSGVYKVALSYMNNDYAIFDADKKIPSFNVSIYPNLIGDFGELKGINIEGYSFKDDENHDKTIYLLDEYVSNGDLSECRVYFPGLYFADSLVASWEGASETPDCPEEAKRVIKNAESPLYWATVNLDELKTTDGKVKVQVTKNGATASYSFNVGKGDRDVTTSVIDSVIDTENDAYYNIQGVRIMNPSHGLFIRVRDGKAEKVIL